MDTAGLKNQLVERLEEALGGGDGDGDAEEELEDVPDVEVFAADAAKLKELEKKDDETKGAEMNGSEKKKDLPKPKPTKEEIEKAKAERRAAAEKAEAERKAAAERAKKEADEAFVKDLERRKERAEKFKLPFALSEQEKARIRNVGAEEKFGLDKAADASVKPTEKTAEQKAKEKADFEAKLRARAERFGDALKPLPKPTPMFTNSKRPGDSIPLPVAKK